jgi:hypothetical protein
MCTLSF